MFWNPFSHLAISENYPLAKVRRSSLRQRFVDTFEVFNGAIGLSDASKNHLGLIDYLFFPIFLPIAYAINYSHGKHKNNFIRALTIAKLPFAALLTLAASLFVLGLHGVRAMVNYANDTALISFTKKKVASSLFTNLDILQAMPDKNQVKLICNPAERCIDVQINNIADVSSERLRWFKDEGGNRIPLIEHNTGVDWILKSNFFHILEQNSTQNVKQLSDSVEQLRLKS